VILKHKKGRIPLVFAVGFVFLLSLFTLNKHVLRVNFDNFLEKLMTYDLGFSNQKNLYDDGELDDYDNWSYLDKLLPAIKALGVSTPDIISRKIFGINSEIVAERLDVDINFKNYQQLLDDRTRAIFYGINKDPVTVKGKVTYKGEAFKAKLRLKGDLFDHWASKYRMSLRVNIKGKSTILGFSKFSMQKPLARQHPYDQTFQSLMRRAGNLSAVHNYLHVYVNGVDWGIMNVEEHVSKELLEKQKTKDSIIVRFGNEDGWFYKRNTNNPNKYYNISDPTLNVKLYDSKKSLEDDRRRKWLSYITYQNTIKNPAIFDVDHHSRALLMATVWNGPHVLHESNSRYYFNPYALNLEPITTDVNQYSRLDKIENIIHKHSFVYSDLIKKKKFKDNLKLNFEIVKEAVLHIKDDLYYYDNFFPINMKKSGQTVLNNLDYVENNLDDFLVLGSRTDDDFSGDKPSIEVGQESDFLDHVHARHYINGDIEVHNLLPDSVMIKGLLIKGKSFDLEPVKIIGYNSAGYIPHLIATEFTGIKDNKIQIVTEFRGDTRITEIGPTLLKDGLYNPLVNPMINNNYIVKSGEGEYELSSGNYVVDDGIVIHGNLTIKPNVSLNFTKNAYLIVKGSLFANGGSNRSIRFSPVGDTWPGLYVLGDGGESLLSGVVISKARQLDVGILNLSSGITFYKSTVKISNVLIKDSTAEDALNLVGSEFVIDNLSIENTYSDALDIDFSNGLITDSSFTKVGGDALDFSGSDVSVSNVEVSMVKDKAFSVGEKSRVDIVNSVISDIGVGIASKDGSFVKGDNIVINDYKLKSAMSYIKKDFYGSPEIELSNCKVSGTNSPYSRQKGSRMVVDGIDVEEDVIDVKKLYRGEIMKK
jgi:hypothetical protein